MAPSPIQPAASSAPAASVPAERDSASIGFDPDFDARWAAWQRHGVAHERAARLKMLVGAPIAVAAAAALWYLMNA